MALIVRQSCSNNMFSQWMVPSNCHCCSFLGNMGGSTNPVAQLTLPAPIRSYAGSFGGQLDIKYLFMYSQMHAEYGKKFLEVVNR